MARILHVACVSLAAAVAVQAWRAGLRGQRRRLPGAVGGCAPAPKSTDQGVLPCITARKSTFAAQYVDKQVDETVVQCLLDAAMWAPFHGPVPPWRFIVLGRQGIVKMQQLTLEFYDAHWREVDWSRQAQGDVFTHAEYQEWRGRIEAQISGRWGPVSYMIAIIMQRQAGSKRMPKWEELAATACAVQNMHTQAVAFEELACYWSSWHSAARDSKEMKLFLGMSAEDKCLGFFIVAACDPTLKKRRSRVREKHLSHEWRA